MASEREAGKERFVTLDLLRGLAALAVLTRHISVEDIPPVLPRSYLAVDFFFVLSGFVLAHAYGRRLAEGLPRRKFVAARLVRLYPLYVLATVVGLFGAWATHAMGPLALGVNALAGLGFVPSPAGLFHPERRFFELDGPAWSLFWELAVNFAWMLLLPRLRSPRLILLVAASAVFLGIAAAWRGDLDFGLLWNGAPIAAVRAAFGFFAGTLVWILRQRSAAPRLPALLLGAALLAALAPDGMGWLYDWAAVALIFPLLVWLGASSEADGAIGSAGLGLGYLSYPLYILQVPLLAVLDRLLAELFGWVETADTAAYFAVAAVWTIGLALIAARCFDDPVRAWLTRRYVGRTVPVAAQTAP